MDYRDGQTYAGEWVDGFRDGFGTYTSNGTVFEGYFRRDLRHGEGTLRRGNGVVMRQIWEDGKLVSGCELVSPQNVGTPCSQQGKERA